MAGVLRLASGRRLRGKGQQTIPRGDTLLIEMPGGGGLGDPKKRDPQHVLADVKLGLVTREAARADYGVVIGDDLAIDSDATDTARRTGG